MVLEHLHDVQQPVITCGTRVSSAINGSGILGSPTPFAPARLAARGELPSAAKPNGVGPPKVNASAANRNVNHIQVARIPSPSVGASGPRARGPAVEPNGFPLSRGSAVGRAPRPPCAV
jgi:hypothetical protein